MSQEGPPPGEDQSKSPWGVRYPDSALCQPPDDHGFGWLRRIMGERPARRSEGVREGAQMHGHPH